VLHSVHPAVRGRGEAGWTAVVVGGHPVAGNNFQSQRAEHSAFGGGGGGGIGTQWWDALQVDPL
jgi:hypothetical protein